MYSLRLFINGIWSHPRVIKYIPKQWKIGQRWYFKRSTPSKIPDICLRNSLKFGYSSKRSTYFWKYSNNDKYKTYQWILSPHMKDCSEGVTNVMQYCQQNCNRFGTKSNPAYAKKTDIKSAIVANPEVDIFGECSKLGLYARFKVISKRYWYVLIPVHVVSSAGWFCAFYYLSQSGVDFQALLEYLNLSENIAEKLQGSRLGHWAIAFLCYKVISPLRYTVTLGLTAVSIKYLVQRGYIKPMPTKAQFMQIMEAKKAIRAAVKTRRNKAKKRHN